MDKHITIAGSKISKSVPAMNSSTGSGLRPTI